MAERTSRRGVTRKSTSVGDDTSTSGDTGLFADMNVIAFAVVMKAIVVCE